MPRVTKALAAKAKHKKVLKKVMDRHELRKKYQLDLYQEV